MKNTSGQNLPSSARPLTGQEVQRLASIVSSQIQVRPAPDTIFPERKILMPVEGLSARVLRGSHGRSGSRNGSWGAATLDSVLSRKVDTILWTQVNDSEIEPLGIAPYTPSIREWLSDYPIWHSMLPNGLTLLDGSCSLLGDIDSEYGIVLGCRAIIEEFDQMSGGLVKICEDLDDYLENKFADFGEGNIYEYMRIYLPNIGGCRKYQ